MTNLGRYVKIIFLASMLSRPLAASWLFDGNTQYVSVAQFFPFEVSDAGSEEDYLTAQSFSLAGWFKIASNVGEGQQYLVSQGTTDTKCVHLWLEEAKSASNPNTLNFKLGDGEGDTLTITSSTTPGESTDWQHVAIVRTTATDTWTMYVNGASVGTAVAASVGEVLEAGTWYFGRNADDSDYYNGYLAEWAKWDRELTATEVDQLSGTNGETLVDPWRIAKPAWYCSMAEAFTEQAQLDEVTITNSGATIPSGPAVHPITYQYTLTLTNTNGAVTKIPSRTTYASGEIVTLVPRPNQGYSFREWTGDVAHKRLVGQITMSANKSVTASFGTWTAPIGIPTPSWGITQTHWKYAGPTVISAYADGGGTTVQATAADTYCFFTGQSIVIAGSDHYDGTYTITRVSDMVFTFTLVGGFVDNDAQRGTARDSRGEIDTDTSDYYKYNYGTSTYYRMGPDGPYTHYVNTATGNDTGNTYGTYASPRATLPVLFPLLGAGSIVEIHGTPVGNSIETDGTETKPRYIRGVAGQTAVWPSTIQTINADYVIVENLTYNNEGGDHEAILIGESSTQHHVAVRGCEFKQFELVPSASKSMIRLKREPDNVDGERYNIVIYACHFHHNGHHRSRPHTRDSIGISHDRNVRNVWIVDNYFHHIGGDAVSFDYDDEDAYGWRPKYVYIGRNACHDNYENVVDLKKCEHIVISQNAGWNFGSYSAMAGAHSPAYRQGDSGTEGDPGRDHIWVLFNEVWNNTYIWGAFYCYNNAAVLNETYADSIYFIGNIVHDCHNSDGDAAAFGFENQQSIYLVNNTVYNCDIDGRFYLHVGASGRTEKLTLLNNIFATTRADGDGYHLFFGGDDALDWVDDITASNNIAYEDGDALSINVKMWVSGTQSVTSETAYNLADFGTAESARYAAIAAGITQADPGFVSVSTNDVHLLPTSAALDAGVYTGTVHAICADFSREFGVDIQKGFDGESRFAPWDPGAFESSPTKVLAQ